MHISRGMHIDAPIEQVFQLVIDPTTRAELNPEATPLRVDVEDAAAPLRVGSICHYRLHMGGRIIDYHMRVTEFEPDRRLVSVSEDTSVPFEVAIELWPEADGTLLVQAERFEPSVEMLDAAFPRADDALPGYVEQALLFVDEDAVLELRQHQEKALQAALEDKLEHWLSAIKTRVEHSKEQP
jgi:uncharacterized protein YndB with AHSA1/START domain